MEEQVCTFTQLDESFMLGEGRQSFIVEKGELTAPTETSFGGSGEIVLGPEKKKRKKRNTHTHFLPDVKKGGDSGWGVKKNLLIRVHVNFQKHPLPNSKLSRLKKT